MNYEIKSVKMTLEESVQNLTKVKQGVVVSKPQLEALNEKLNGLIPKWYSDILEQFPIADLILGWQLHEPEQDFDGIEEIQILNINLLEELNTDSYPGIYLKPLNFLIIGYGASWAGNCFAIPTNNSDDPPLYEVWHDIGHSSQEIKEAIETGKCKKVVSKLSEFFSNAKV